MSRTLSSIVIGLVLPLLCAVAGSAAEPQLPQASMTVAGLIFGSGWTEWILLLLSVVAFAVGIQRFLTIKREALVPDGLVDDIHNIFAEGVTDESFEEALNSVSGEKSMLGEVLQAALDKREFGFDSMKEASETVGAAEYNKYMSQIAWISLIAAVAPMLGLFGTVWGITGAFMQLASSTGPVNPAMLAGNIGTALVTTVTGLIIAMPMIGVFFFLRSRINACTCEVSTLSAEVLDYFRAAK